MMLAVLVLTACSANPVVPKEHGHTEGDTPLVFAVYAPRNPDAQYSELMVGKVASANGCLVIHSTHGRDFVPLFPIQVTAVRTLGVGDVLVLHGVEEGDRASFWESQDKTIARLGVNMPPECPYYTLFQVTTPANDPLVPGTTVDDPVVEYAWQDPFTFDVVPPGDTDGAPGEVVDRNGCLTIDPFRDGEDFVLPVFPLSRRIQATSTGVGLTGWLGVVDGPDIRLVLQHPSHDGSIRLEPTSTVIGHVRGLRIPAKCEQTPYLFVVW